MRITLEITKSAKTLQVVVDGPATLSHDWHKAVRQLEPFVPHGYQLTAYRQEWSANDVCKGVTVLLDETGEYARLVITAPRNAKLPQFFINQCHVIAGYHGASIEWIRL